MSRTVVMWFRRDLRLADLPALRLAAGEGDVVPLFVVDPAFAAAGGARRAFLAAGLESLDDSMDGELVCRHGDPVDVVPAVAAEVGAVAVFVTRDYAPYGRRRDAAVGAALRELAVEFHGVGSNYAVDPGGVTKADGGPYAVFTPFARAWRAVGWRAPTSALDVSWRGARSMPTDGVPATTVLPFAIREASEQAAHDRWDRFARHVDRYDEQRDLAAVDGTSRMSAALRWGLVHPRQLLADLGPDRGSQAFANELAWREFYADVLLREPRSAWHNLDRRMDAMPIDTDADARRRFQRWATGSTGFPFVDAGLRQLLATGWMHNRLRMVTASFLVKDLHLPWQWGARHFLDHLVDGDLASNNHGWQWAAGTGTDAAPYFRIFNPTTQGERFDPEGDYVRRWIPELAGIPGRAVHSPGARRPDDYPSAMVDHAAERLEALDRYRHAAVSSR
ncbi:MAG TPA: deoxyribodipyrimidine photo-lyase [Ilumatobacteraceae bacterium]|nr:deoxyribodipyrimidine photo-lyase [Ilumatobacteraceae bacterium]